MKLPRHFRTCTTSEKSFWTFWQSRRLLKIMKNSLKLPRHSRTSKTSVKASLTFGQSRRLLKIFEKYFEASKTFQDLLNFRKVILDPLAIQEAFKNHTKIFYSLQDIPGIVKLQKSYPGPSDNPVDL